MPSQPPSTPTPTTTNTFELEGKMPLPQQHSMDDIISLHCRIAALEAELRHEKEKLLDAQNGSLYLVSIFGQNHKLVVDAQQDQEIETLQSQLEEERQANAHLKRLLTTSEWAKGTLETGEEPEQTTSSPAVEEEDGVGDLLGSISGEEESQEMSKIQDENSCSVSVSVSEKGVRDGWANLQLKIDEKKSMDARKEPVIKRVRFLDHEHTRLAGFACYIEEIKDPHEYAEHWIDYANKHQDHTAEEWRSYYESQIRPARFETGTAQPVHMHSYSMDEVKQYDIPTTIPVQPVAVDSPLQHSKWASPQPINRWPAPEPRPPMTIKSPYTKSTYQSYEVTQFPASQDISLRRTVLVSNIPIGMTLADVFSQLQSDRILEAKFAGTAGMKTLPPIMTNAAIVEFLDNEDAQMFVGVYGKHGVFEIRLIETPTRPLRRARVDSGYN